MASIGSLGPGGSLLSRAYQRVIVNSENLDQAARRFRDARNQNDDRVLRLEEFGAAPETFRRVDIRSRGALGLSDIQRMFATEASRPSRSQMIDRIVGNRDIDRNGTLNEVELRGIASDFARLDRNGDGEVSRAELSRRIQEAIEIEREIDFRSRNAGSSRPTEPSGGSPVKTSRHATERFFLLRAFGENELALLQNRRHPPRSGADPLAPATRFSRHV